MGVCGEEYLFGLRRDDYAVFWGMPIRKWVTFDADRIMSGTASMYL